MKMPLFQSQFSRRDDLVSVRPSATGSSPPSSPSVGKIRPLHAVLFVIIILALVFFISGFLELLLRILIPHKAKISLFLFNIHDSGRDHTFIDALSVFHYKEIVCLKEPLIVLNCLNNIK